MSKTPNPFENYVFSLSSSDFELLKESIYKRIDNDKYGFTSFEEAALHYSRKPICPNCGSSTCTKDGKTNAGFTRYRCKKCDNSYTLLANSIFNSAKISLHKLMNYIELMSFYVPLDLMCEVLDIAKNTAELWRKKIFNTVNNYQDHLILSDLV